MRGDSRIYYALLMLIEEKMMKKTFKEILLVILLFTLAACGKNASVTTWQEQYDLGEKYLLEEDYEAAIVAFTAAIEIDPKEIEAYTGLVKAYTQTQDYEAAASTVDGALDILKTLEMSLSDESLDGFVNSAAEAYGNVSDVERQYNFWISLIEIYPDESGETLNEQGAAALAQLGQVYTAQEDYEQAEAAFNHAIELDPQKADYYLLIAEMYFAQGKYEEGISALEAGYELTGEETLNARIVKVQEEQQSVLEENLKKIVDQMEVQFTVDDVQLGVTELEDVAAIYGNRTGAELYYSRQNGIEKLHSVRAYFGENGDQIVDGYEEGDVDFEFSAMFISRTTVNAIKIENPDFLCLGALRVNDDFETVLELYGLGDAWKLCGDGGSYSIYQTESGKRVDVGYWDNGNEFFMYTSEDGYHIEIEGHNGKIYSIYMVKD